MREKLVSGISIAVSVSVILWCHGMVGQRFGALEVCVYKVHHPGKLPLADKKRARSAGERPYLMLSEQHAPVH